MLTIQKRTLEEVRLRGDTKFELSVEEMHAFIGLCLIRGVQKGRDEPIKSFRSEQYGRSYFREALLRDKFLEIMRYLQFDHKGEKPKRRETDKFAPIRDLWENVRRISKKVSFLIARLLLMGNSFHADADALLYNICRRSLLSLA